MKKENEGGGVGRGRGRENVETVLVNGKGNDIGQEERGQEVSMGWGQGGGWTIYYINDHYNNYTNTIYRLNFPADA